MPHDGSGPTSLLKPQALNALRDLVYSDLIGLLPPASIDQSRTFMANLRLPNESIWKFLEMRVSPELAETPYCGLSTHTILRFIEVRYGEHITSIAGFYRDVRGKLCWTVPRGCALYPYRSNTGFYNGILCQPLYTIDTFWLLTSAKFGGPKALRLTDFDAALFEAGLVTFRPPPRRSSRSSQTIRTGAGI